MATLHSTAPTLVEEVEAPVTADVRPDWRHLGVTAVSEALSIETVGNTDLADTAPMLVANLANQRNTEKHLFIAVAQTPAETVLGYAWVSGSRLDNPHMAFAKVSVLPSARRHGIGSRLWHHTLDQVRAMGRTTVMTETATSPEPAPDDPYALAAPTGSGQVDVRDGGVRFAQALGFSLEQVERHSQLELPVDPLLLEQLREDAAAIAGPDYALITWQDRVPDEWLDQYCVLQTRMSTDAPMAGLDWQEMAWDAARVDAQEKVLRDCRIRTFSTAAMHRPTRRLVGFTELEVPLDKPGVVYQENTLVLKEHRGHRLGMCVKAANLQHLAREHPQARRVHTGNAQENSFMLDINVALGFRQVSVWGAWQLVL